MARTGRTPPPPQSVNSGSTLDLGVGSCRGENDSEPHEGESGLEKAQRVLAERRANGEVAVRKTPLERLAEQPTSKAKAIAAKCYDCVGGPNADNGWHRAIRECGCKRCPLYSLRPGARRHAEQEVESDV